MLKLLLIGVTGLVGSHVLARALEDSRIDEVVALARRPLQPHPKLTIHQVDFEKLPGDAHIWQVDAVICTLGTTIRQAGSKAAFRHVDVDYPLAVARLARQHNTPAYVLNSAIGANADSRFFYNRVKGELELALSGMGFRSLTFVRPGLIGGHRATLRMGEHAMARLLGAIGPILPRRWRINPAHRIAEVLLESAITAQGGQHVITSDNMV